MERFEDSRQVHGFANVIAQQLGTPLVASEGHSFWPMCSFCATLV
jgi:hypothetical protein